MSGKIVIKRIYRQAGPDDGYRLLVDRLWPRGIKKELAQLNEWNKEIAPSEALRKWFGHKPELFVEFAEKYKQELQQKSDELLRMKKIAYTQTLTLLYAAKDERFNQAVVLKQLLDSLE